MIIVTKIVNQSGGLGETELLTPVDSVPYLMPVDEILRRIDWETREEMERRVDKEVCAIDEDKRGVWSEPSKDGVDSLIAVHHVDGSMVQNVNQNYYPES